MKDYYEIIPTEVEAGWHWLLREYTFSEEAGDYVTRERQGTATSREDCTVKALLLRKGN